MENKNSECAVTKTMGIGFAKKIKMTKTMSFATEYLGFYTGKLVIYWGFQPPLMMFVGHHFSTKENNNNNNKIHVSRSESKSNFQHSALHSTTRTRSEGKSNFQHSALHSTTRTRSESKSNFQHSALYSTTTKT